ncbi:MAG: sodium:solute symporter family protein [Sedimentisphaerales bacterium]|nr:sodium:solute symporter family protein [Sedimentisphaerales bacterium]
MLAQAVGLPEILVVLAYLLAVIYLGWLGYRKTTTATDYLVAGRQAHPFIMALSYGATFISTSAIVGFGGVAGLFGMSLLWLTFCNIFIGIFIAFVLLGGPARRLGHRLDAHTFPELLGRRFDSKFIQILAGLIIFFFMPLYGAAVLIGGTEFVSTAFNIDYDVAMLVFSVIVAAYVFAGGLKGVMYTDALQGVIMFVGMVTLLIFAYYKVDGLTEGHRTLTSLADLVPAKLKAMGHQGWTATPAFGFGDAKYDLWWITFSTIVLGVGIGVLAQPQLVVRFMTVKSKRELNRAALSGGIFILAMTGIAFTVGALSNAYFAKHGALFKGTIVKTVNEDKTHAIIQLAKQNTEGTWESVFETDEKTGQTAVDPQTGKPKPKIVPVVLDAKESVGLPAIGAGEAAKPLVAGRSISIVYAKGNPDQIIPTYISAAMPKWFGLLFLLTMLAAAMSTLSSQFHTLGTAMGRDVYEQITGQHGKSVLVTRMSIIIGLFIAVILGHYTRGGYIIARATAIFFGLCASAFLPTFIGGLFFKRMTRTGAIASMVAGFTVTAFWLLFVKTAEAKAIGLVQIVTGGKDSILAGYPNWPVVDPLVIALPISILVAIVASLLSTPPDKEHLSKCFGK